MDKPKSTRVRSVHVYNKEKTILLKTFSTVNSFIRFSNQNGSSVKLLCKSDKLWLEEYFITYDLIPGADNYLTKVGEFNPKLNNRRASIPVYIYSDEGKIFIKRFSSLR